MKTIAYLSSYNTSKEEFYKDIELQQKKIEDYAFQNNIYIERFFTEELDANDTSKPVLLNIIHDYYGVLEKIIVQDLNTISRNKDFQYWITDELKRIGVEIIFLDKAQDVQPKKVLEKTISIKSKVKNISSLPHVVTKVMELIQNQNSSADDLAKIISNDLGLTSKVLKIVNSSIYGFQKQISSIRHAIVVLGFTNIKGIVLSAGIFKMFSPQKNQIFDYEKFWQHSILTAIGAKELSKYDEQFSSEDIFSIAFLHDLGKIILAQYDCDNYLSIYSKIEQEENYKVKFKTEEETCGINHSEIAYSILNSWNLPSVFSEVSLYHHTPQLSNDYEKVCTIVNFTDIIVNDVLYNREFCVEKFNQDLLFKFNISEDMLLDLHNFIKEQSLNVQDITGFFN